MANLSAVHCRTFPIFPDHTRKMPLRADLRIPDDLASVVMRHKPSYLSLSAFCLHLIALGVDSNVTLAERPKGSEASNSSITSNKKKDKSLNRTIPAALEPLSGLINDFFRVKKGSKGEVAWKLLMTNLSKIREKYGDAVVAAQLELGINGKWAGITLERYEQFGRPASKGSSGSAPLIYQPKPDTDWANAE
jgi:hypothetical protein